MRDGPLAALFTRTDQEDTGMADDEETTTKNERLYRTFKRWTPAELADLLEEELGSGSSLDTQAIAEVFEGQLGPLWEDVDVYTEARAEDAARTSAHAVDKRRQLPDGDHAFAATPMRNWSETTVPVRTERKVG